MPTYSEEGVKKSNEKYAVRKKWLLDHGLTQGIMIFDNKAPRGFGTGLSRAFSELDLLDDWTQANQVTEFPQLDDLTIWVGYKHVH